MKQKIKLQKTNTTEIREAIERKDKNNHDQMKIRRNIPQGKDKQRNIMVQNDFQEDGFLDAITFHYDVKVFVSNKARISRMM